MKKVRKDILYHKVFWLLHICMFWKKEEEEKIYFIVKYADGYGYGYSYSYEYEYSIILMKQMRLTRNFQVQMWIWMWMWKRMWIQLWLVCLEMIGS